MSKLKIEQCITESCKEISAIVEEYLSTIKRLRSDKGPLNSLVAHVTTLRTITNSPDIEDTETYKLDPDLKLKLELKIQKCIEEVKSEVQQTIDDLEKLMHAMEKHCDKVHTVFNQERRNLSLHEIAERTGTFFSVSEKIEAVDRFKRNFYDHHNCRFFSLILLDSGGDTNKFMECWDPSALEPLLKDLQCYALN
ncbi:hypothetical protein JTE90_001999 [Oedothorax gibbosus]|uniref:Uncharacterized protein n=1 Tax=Oedothorax gibbosus TaxID=931172 RepID=A0AAV6U8T3_9ARAC|nr:hypothetical protein JTE90_001999 [Oedothorax gibbosus]